MRKHIAIAILLFLLTIGLEMRGSFPAEQMVEYGQNNVLEFTNEDMANHIIEHASTGLLQNTERDRKLVFGFIRKLLQENDVQNLERLYAEFIVMRYTMRHPIINWSILILHHYTTPPLIIEFQ